MVAMISEWWTTKKGKRNYYRQITDVWAYATVCNILEERAGTFYEMKYESWDETQGCMKTKHMVSEEFCCRCRMITLTSKEKVGAVHVPQLAYERFRLEVMPPNRFFNKASIMRPWRRILGDDRASKR